MKKNIGYVNLDSSIALYKGTDLSGCVGWRIFDG